MFFTRILRQLTEWLDALLGLAGRIGILLAVVFVVYVAVQLLLLADEPSETRAGKILALLHHNWRAALLVLAPLLYLPLRSFLDSVTEIRLGGTEFRREKFLRNESDDDADHSGG